MSEESDLDELQSITIGKWALWYDYDTFRTNKCTMTCMNEMLLINQISLL